MKKFFILGFASIWISACSAHTLEYYHTHPKVLQEELKNCPYHEPKGVTCEQLQDIALRLNDLSYELRANPQGYGQKILALQQTLGEQETALQQKAGEPTLKESIDKTKRHLEERLAVVKWLESPGG